MGGCLELVHLLTKFITLMCPNNLPLSVSEGHNSSEAAADHNVFKCDCSIQSNAANINYKYKLYYRFLGCSWFSWIFLVSLAYFLHEHKTSLIISIRNSCIKYILHLTSKNSYCLFTIIHFIA